MKEIALTQGKFAIVDDEDFEWLIQWKWHFMQNGYAARDQWIPRKKICMHSQIMDTPVGKVIDHINGNKLDNRKENLRICNRSENAINSKIRSDNASGYRGICWHKKAKKWEARINLNKKEIYLGLYVDINDAILAYKNAALKYHKNFTRVI